MPNLLPPQLTLLEQTGLIRLASATPELAYLFRHALVREAAYQSLLKSDRRVLHKAVGEVLEQLSHDHLTEVAPILAQHFAEIGDAARALHYHCLAGEAALRRYACAEAVWHFAHAQAFIAQATPTQVQQLFLAWGRALELSGQYPAAAEVYAQLEAEAQTRGSAPLELAALLARATLLCAPTMCFDATAGEALSLRTLQMAQALNDPAAEAQSLWHLTLLCKFTGRDAEQVRYGEAALRLARTLGLLERQAFILNDLSFGYLIQMRLNAGLAAMQEASQLWQTLDNQAMRTDSLAGLALLQHMAGQSGVALANAQQAYAISCAIKNFWGQGYSLWHMAIIQIAMGDWQQAQTNLEMAIEACQHAGFLVGEVGAGAGLAELYGHLGLYDLALARAQTAVLRAEAVSQWGSWPLAAMVYTYIGLGDLVQAQNMWQAAQRQSENAFIHSAQITSAGLALALAQKDYAAALAQAQRFTRQMRVAQLVSWLIEALYAQGAARHGLGQWAEALAVWQEAASLAENSQVHYWHWRILKDLLPLQQQCGQLNHTQLAQAQNLIPYLAERLPPAHQAAFWANPANQRLQSLSK